MNHLPPRTEDTWALPRHAHVVVYEREDESTDDGPDADPDGRDADGLLTIYDCGAAQSPPSAQLLGTLEAVDVDAESTAQPDGRIVSLREEAMLELVGDRRYRIVERPEHLLGGL